MKRAQWMSRRVAVLAAAFGLLLSGLPAAQAAESAAACPKLLQHRFARLQGEAPPQDLCEHAGKVLLVVNTASFCGYTRQYEGLEALHERYRERGLVVLGFPSNDFGGQEPGGAKEIAEFCRTTYGIRFPLHAKSSVVTPQGNALYDDLAARTGTRPKWNFHKYLVDRRGETVQSFDSAVTPLSPEFVTAVERLLAQAR